MDYDVLKTPCIVYNENDLSNNISSFSDAIKKAWSNKAVLGYSVKTAPIGKLISVAHALGSMIEVVSDDEFDLALSVDVPASDIIFNGPIKSREKLFFAYDNGCIVNLDSKRELRWTAEYSAERRIVPRFGLRFNFDLEAVAPGETPAGDEGGRFGFCVEDGSLLTAVNQLADIGLVPVGLHGHFSSKTHSERVYRAIAQELCFIKREMLSNDLEYVDIGGGFYGGGENTNLYDSYARCIAQELSKEFDPNATTLIIEPGGSILATTACYYGRVVDVKTIRGRHFVVTELSKLNLNSTVFSRRLFRFSRFHTEKRPLAGHQTICGYTCMEMDRLFDCSDEELFKEGDLIAIHNAGAYTASFSPAFFIQHLPKLYLDRIGGEVNEMNWNA